MIQENEFWTKLKERFNVLPDKDDEAQIIQSIKDDAEFKGVRIWVLICAIFIASLGLNVNSTAVIIGAMLISPLMNPIVGIGLGLGIYDIALVRKSFKNLGIMTVISIITATLYFLLSPLSQAQSELLARTQPTIYDVLIAFVGGVAGILASSSRFKGNIIMGVAIATALMPPLCTAGYGLSQWNMSYFLGAGYLFTINAIFIALSTLIVVRIMKFRPVNFISSERERKIRHWIIGVTICVAVPSIYSGFQLVQASILEDSTNRFVRRHLNTNDRQTLHHSLIAGETTMLDVALIGRRVDSLEHDSLERVMRDYYGLADVGLHIRQSFTTSTDSLDLQINKKLLEHELSRDQGRLIAEGEHQRDSLQRLLDEERKHSASLRQAEAELTKLFPEVQSCRLLRSELGGKALALVLYQSDKALDSEQATRLSSWLQTRLEVELVELHKL